MPDGGSRANVAGSGPHVHDLRSKRASESVSVGAQVQTGAPSPYGDVSTGVGVSTLADILKLPQETPVNSRIFSTALDPLDPLLEVSSEIPVHSSLEEEDEQTLLRRNGNSSSGEDPCDVGDDEVLLYEAEPAPVSVATTVPVEAN